LLSCRSEKEAGFDSKVVGSGGSRRYCSELEKNKRAETVIHRDFHLSETVKET
jgi:hypothetical protein